MITMSILRALVVALAIVILATACGGDPPLNLSAEAAEGREIANSNGCAACHGRRGQGTTAPPWQGLYLERVKLDGEATIVADDDYLYRSITEPQAEIRRGWTIKMPKNELSDDQIAKVITYIKELK